MRRFGRHGVANTLQQLWFRFLRSTLQLRILRGVQIDRAHPAYLDCNERFTPGFPPAKALRQFASDPANEMSPEFVRDAGQNGDECYAICDGGKLASYGWYATRPTPIGLPGLLLHFSPRYVYMYKGFTDSGYRGQRLHAIGMTRALEHYLAKGYGGIVSYVEATNFDSLKSCFRMGYEVFGSVYLLRIFGRTFAFSSPGCRRFEFRVETAASPAPQLQRGKL